MKQFKFIIISLFCITFATQAFGANVWLNDLTTLFTNKSAIIYEINVRTFNAVDKDGNGIISKNEQKGNFINATRRLDELAETGVNTIKLMPVLPVGKVHAKGTAGSLFAPSAFNKINPQLASRNNAYEDMRRFVNECHKRRIRVIVDLPACAAYDLYAQRPELFLKDSANNPIAPKGFNDVRILNAGTESKINNQVYKLYSDFTKMMLDLSVDGIAVSMPETKPAAFWKKLVAETKKYDSEFLFLAETSSESKEIFKNSVPILSLNELLNAGFDGYTSDYYSITSVKNDFYSIAKSDISNASKFDSQKAAVANFAPYNKVTPTVNKGVDYSRQLIWLTNLLPVNSYYLDGFTTADNYMYTLSNKKAASSLTDDKMYSMDRGQIDIYNFSRKPGGLNYDIYTDFVVANRFKIMAAETLSKGSFVPLKTSNSNIIAYARNYNNSTVIIIANTEKTEFENIKIKVSKLNNELFAVPIKVSQNVPTVSKGEIETNLAPLETQVILFQQFALK